MSTVAEIEDATELLPRKEQEELFFFLVKKLRADGAKMPETTLYSSDQVEAWVAQDEADMQAFREGRET